MEASSIIVVICDLPMQPLRSRCCQSAGLSVSLSVLSRILYKLHAWVHACIVCTTVGCCGCGTTIRCSRKSITSEISSWNP